MDAVFYSILSFLSCSDYECLIGPMEALKEIVCPSVCVYDKEREGESDQQSVYVLMDVVAHIHTLCMT